MALINQEQIEAHQEQSDKTRKLKMDNMSEKDREDMMYIESVLSDITKRKIPIYIFANLSSGLSGKQKKEKMMYQYNNISHFLDFKSPAKLTTKSAKFLHLMNKGLAFHLVNLYLNSSISVKTRKDIESLKERISNVLNLIGNCFFGTVFGIDEYLDELNEKIKKEKKKS